MPLIPDTLPLQSGAASAALLEKCIDQLVHQFGADEIWLFGSVARGEVGPDSDVDLLVIRRRDYPNEPMSRNASRLLAPHQGNLPLGVQVVTPEEWSRGLGDPNSYFSMIRNEGRRLYAR